MGSEARRGACVVRRRRRPGPRSRSTPTSPL